MRNHSQNYRQYEVKRSKCDQTYNEPFTENEQKAGIRHQKFSNTDPEEDIHTQMIKKLSQETRKFLPDIQQKMRRCNSKQLENLNNNCFIKGKRRIKKAMSYRPVALKVYSLKIIEHIPRDWSVT